MSKRLMKDYREIADDPNSPFQITLVQDNMKDWIVEFDGPEETNYTGLHFRLSVKFTVLFIQIFNIQDKFPFQVPRFQFLSKVQKMLFSYFIRIILTINRHRHIKRKFFINPR